MSDQGRVLEGRTLDDRAPGVEGESTATWLTYTVGLGLAILATIASFVVSQTNLLWEPGVPVGLIVLAIAQIGVHLVFFLHLGSGPDHTNNILALAFGLLDCLPRHHRIVLDHRQSPRQHDASAYAITPLHSPSLRGTVVLPLKAGRPAHFGIYDSKSLISSWMIAATIRNARGRICTTSRKFSRKSVRFSVASAAAKSIIRTPSLAHTSRVIALRSSMCSKGPALPVLLVGQLAEEAEAVLVISFHQIRGQVLVDDPAVERRRHGQHDRVRDIL